MMRKFIVILTIIMALLPLVAQAQEPRLYGDRLVSKDGKWLLPIASLHLTSTEQDHLGRGSVQAWDITGPKLQVVYPIADGIVEFAGCELQASHGYGCYIVIFYPEYHKRTIFAHCGINTVQVKRNQEVTAWTPLCGIDFVGKTSFGPHVHFELHEAPAMDKYVGKRYDIGQFWDSNAMTYEKMANAKSNEVITKIGVVTAAGQRLAVNGDAVAPTPKQNLSTVSDATRTVPMLAAVLYRLGALPTGMLAVFVIILIFLLVFGGKTIRAVSLSGAVCFALIGLTTQTPLQVLGKERQVQQVKQQVQQESSIPADEAFEIAYKFAMRWEGKKCTEDGAHTMAGVTQGAYNRFRKRHSLPTADVCGSLTESERKQIAYEDYWLKSGADKLPYPLNVVHLDFAFNAGSEPGGPPAQLLAQCGGIDCDPLKYLDLRKTWYQSRKTCRLYCGGWLRRTEDLRKLIQQ